MNSFKHIQSAHCENGVTSSLLNHFGVQGITEPLAFGIGSGLFYIHVPFMKINGGPAISYRTFPGAIFKRTCKLLNIPVVSKKFRSQEKSLEYLNNLLDKNLVTGCQVGVFNLPYFPKEYRFHFNAHNIIIYGRENGKYLVSDPTMEETTFLSEKDLQTVRFAKGALAPKGHLYAPLSVDPDQIDIKSAIIKGIKRNSRDMLKIPGKIAGVRGIGYTGDQIPRWREKYGIRKTGLYLGQIIRMQEEIGTGGGGFRFIYAAFLEQAYEHIKNEELLSISNEFTKSGDLWRNNAVAMAQVLKGVQTEPQYFLELRDRFKEIESVEHAAFKRLASLRLT